MKKQSLLSVLLLLALLAAAIFTWKPYLFRRASAACKMPKHLNVILIVVDALRADHLSCYGYSRATSPNIDRISGQGILFERAYTHVPLTLPTFTTMFTSRYPHSHKVKTPFRRLSSKALTLAEILKNRGWQTAAVVGASNLDSHLGLDQGFEFYNDSFREDNDSILFQHKGKNEYQRKAQEVNELVIDWLNRRQKSRNFFLFIHYIDPHSPYSPPPPYDTTYSGGEDQNEQSIALYDGEAQYVDKQIGELYDYLKKSNLLPETLIIITSDHGEGLGDHNYQFHGGKLYEADVRVPLLIMGPNLRQGHRITKLYQHVDLAPTMLAYLNLPIPASFQGISHLASLKGKQPIYNREYVLLEKAESKKDTMYMWAVRGTKEKFIWSSDGNHEFYDLEKDPAETKNLFRKENERAMQLFTNGFQFRSRFSPDPLVGKKENATVELEEDLKALGYVQ
jgi:arylsulfatase A-like enzyme